MIDHHVKVTLGWLSSRNCSVSSRSWFITIRDICLQYGLPHPLEFLRNLRSKSSFKALVKKHVISYWEQKLRAEAAALSSLKYFHPEYMSLTAPHPIWTTAGPNPHQVSMSTVQAIILSGRYRTEAFCSKWSTSSPGGTCRAPSCSTTPRTEDLHHILALCPSLEPTRTSLREFTRQYSAQHSPCVQELLVKYLNPENPMFVQFLLDCTALYEVRAASQANGSVFLCQLFRVTRTWCNSIHRARLKILGRWTKF